MDDEEDKDCVTANWLLNNSAYYIEKARERLLSLAAANAKLEADNARMRKALEDIASQFKTDETEQEGDIEYGYDAIIDVSRKALGGS